MISIRESTNLGNNLDKLDDISQRIEAGLVKRTGEKIQDFYIQTASKVLNSKQANIERGTKQNKNKGHNKKKWFDTYCNNLKRDVRKLGRYKKKDPHNTFLRDKYHENLLQYKRRCGTKKNKLWQNNFIMLEKSCDDPKEFWNKWKNCTDHFVTNLGSKISVGGGGGMV